MPIGEKRIGRHIVRLWTAHRPLLPCGAPRTRWPEGGGSIFIRACGIINECVLRYVNSMEKGQGTGTYNHILKYTSLFGGVQGLNILISLVRNKAVALLLGPSGMGLVSLFQTTVNFISQATNLGISFSAVRNVSELFDTGDEERISHFIKVVRAWSMLTGLVGMLLCIVIGPMLSSLTFSWGDHTLHFVLLSPLVFLLAVTGGETAILKGARQLRSLAVIQVYSVIAALVISLPIYYLFGQTGIVPVMVLMGLGTLLLTIRRSFRLYPLRLTGARILGEGMGMVRLGVAFTLAGVLGSGAEFVIRSYLNNVGDLKIVGLYNTGYLMTMTYAGLIFSAMETDFFPRLSAVNSDVLRYNDLINKQAEVSVLLISPVIVIAFYVLPIMVPLLASGEFLPVVDMMRFVALSLFLRAVNLPMEYLSLAKGASSSYLFLESVYDVLMVVLVILGYQLWGLTGTGVAILAVTVLNTVLVISFVGCRFQVRLCPELIRTLLIQMSIGMLAFYGSLKMSGIGYWLAGVVFGMLSLGVSVIILRRKTHLWEKLKDKMLKRVK